jgi:hypothetical protein
MRNRSSSICPRRGVRPHGDGRARYTALYGEAPGAKIVRKLTMVSDLQTDD